MGALAVETGKGARIAIIVNPLAQLSDGSRTSGAESRARAVDHLRHIVGDVSLKGISKP
jgi:hypothetical protein